MSEQTKADIVELRSALDAIESGGHYCTFPSGNIVMWEDHFPGIRAALDELERLRAERPGWREALERIVHMSRMTGVLDGLQDWADEEWDNMEEANSCGFAEGLWNAAKIARAALHPSVAEGRQPKDE